jgi:hypothetical protein
MRHIEAGRWDQVGEMSLSSAETGARGRSAGEHGRPGVNPAMGGRHRTTPTCAERLPGPGLARAC